MYQLANTRVTILRGFVYDDEGDLVQGGVPVYSGILAYISPPAQSPFRPIVFGATVYEPSSETPSTTREIPCILPAVRTSRMRIRSTTSAFATRTQLSSSRSPAR